MAEIVMKNVDTPRLPLKCRDGVAGLGGQRRYRANHGPVRDPHDSAKGGPPSVHWLELKARFLSLSLSLYPSRALSPSLLSRALARPRARTRRRARGRASAREEGGRERARESESEEPRLQLQPVHRWGSAFGVVVRIADR